MASLYVAEFPSSGVQQGTGIPVALVTATGAVAEQKLAIGGGSVAGVAFNTNTKIVRVHTDAICSIKFGPVSTVAATTSTMRLCANQTEYFCVQPNGVLTIAVISNT